MLEQGKSVTMKEQQQQCYGLTATPVPCATPGEEVGEGVWEEGTFSLLLVSYCSRLLVRGTSYSKSVFDSDGK